MTHTFTRRFKVRIYEVDSFGHVNNAVYVNYLQEAAIEASADAGFSREWYNTQGAGWVIRKLMIRYLTPAVYGDELEVRTWIGTFGRVRCNREYEISRLSDGQKMVRARADWVYVDLKTGQPVRLPEELVEAFEAPDEVPDIGVRIRSAQPIEDSYRYRHRRRVQIYELDDGQHVNHANYLHWIEQAYLDALEASLAQRTHSVADGVVILQGGHEIEYFLPAFYGDSIEIVSWVSEMAKVRGAWTHEVYNADSGQLLARDYSLGVFLNEDLRPALPPAEAIKRVIAGPLSK